MTRIVQHGENYHRCAATEEHCIASKNRWCGRAVTVFISKQAEGWSMAVMGNSPPPTGPSVLVTYCPFCGVKLDEET